ncbi:hypothetical protein PED39_05920 [Methanomassiliicoccales archaeon LGM-RCC1]|nr:hypothetical protein PED39_05920 [Methanomassiliicoccales archaeon LGM-RCC1]
MEKNNLIIIAVAAVIVLAAAAVIALGGAGGGNYDNLKMTSLPIYGNANEDYTIDSKDVELIRENIGGDLSKYPYADADGDDAITENDAVIVEKLIAGESTKIRFIDQYVYDTGDIHLLEIDYPLKNLVTINPDMLQLMFTFDGDEKVIGYIANKSSYTNTFYKADHNGVSKCLGTTARQIKTSEWEAIKNTDSEYHDQGGIGAILAYNDNALGDYKDDLLVAGIPVIYIRCTDPLYSIDATMLLGFLLGPDYFQKALNYANDSRKAIVDVTEAVAKLDEKDRTKFIAMCMWRYISQHESQYTKIGTQAGGIDVANLEGNGSTQINDVEAITIYNGKIDYIMNCHTCDCTVVSPSYLFENSDLDIIRKSSEFENMFFLNLSMPTPCRVMYAAAMFYPDIVSMSDANKYFQTMVDKYLSYLDNTVADNDFNVVQDMMTVITYQDYLDYRGGDEPKEIESNISTVALANRFWNIMKDDLNSNLDPMIDYSYTPYVLSPDNNSQESKVVSDGSTYYIKYTLVEDAKSKYEEIKATYEAKVGTTARTSGICTELPFSNGLTEGYGYYVNSDPDAEHVLGSMKFVGYIDHCLVDLQIVKRPSFSMDDLAKLIDAAYPSESGKSAKTWLQTFDSTSLNVYLGSPYTLDEGATDTYANISAADSGNGNRHVEVDSSANSFATYSKAVSTYRTKTAGYDTEGTEYLPLSTDGFEDAFGYIIYRTQVSGYMIYFAGYVDGCSLDLTLRYEGTDYTVDRANTLIQNILKAEP